MSTQEKKQPEMVEVNADSLEALADNIQNIANSLVDVQRVINKRALILLIQDNCHTKISQKDVSAVLNSITNLDIYALTQEARLERSKNGKG